MIFIRQSAKEDLGYVCDLAVLSWQPILDGYLEQMGEELFTAFYGDWKAVMCEEVKNNFASNPSRAFVVVDNHDDKNGANETIIGFFSYFIDENKGTVASNALILLTEAGE